MKKPILLITVLLLASCKTPRTITEDRTENLSELTGSSLSVSSYDSLLEVMRSILSFQFELRQINYSAPDSSGTQHVTSEQIITGSGQKTDEKTTHSGSEAFIQQNDSTNRNEQKQIHTTIKEKKSFWQLWKEKIIGALVVIGGIGLAALVVWIARRMKRK